MRQTTLLLALAACSLPSGDQPLVDTWDPDAADFADALMPSELPSPPPGVAPTLTASTAVPGHPMTWTVTDLDPNERVYLGRAAAGLGAGPCPPVAGGVCLDIADPVVLQGTARANAAGVATFELTVPHSAPPGFVIAFQAMAVRGTGGVDTVKSNALEVTVAGINDPAAPVGLNNRPSNTTCLPPERPPSDASLTLTRRYSGVGFSIPTTLVQEPNDNSWWYVGEQSGLVKRFQNTNSVSTTSTVLDIRSRVQDGGSEQGLLSLALHPDFDTNGYMYVAYTAGNFFNSTSRISRFTSNNDGASFNANSEVVLVEVSQPASNHNGGHVLFGPDGYLYWGFGDGGSANDPWNNAQNVNNMLGTMIRIDVDRGNPYGIPADNPFASGGGAPEVFAWGLRNPWRWSFDSLTGDIWVGDVGQDRREEIALVEKGSNHGWKIMEGNFCANPGAGTCDDPAFTPPVWDYPHSPGSKSVIGGYVYRGSNIPSIYGTYLYAEFYTGEILGLFYDASTGEPNEQVVASRSGLQTASFAEDRNGELYILDYAGRIYEIEEATGAGTTPFPGTLSETGCMAPGDPGEPGPALIGYEPNSQLWSDDLDKRRWFALPDGADVTVEADGDMDFPIGTVIFKEFAHNGTKVETRMMVRHLDGDWGAYDYLWNDTQTEAFLITNGAEVDLGTQTWSIPSQAECMACHTDAAGRTLGLEVGQLNSPFDYDGTTANQLHTLDEIGLFSPAQPAVANLDTLPGLDEQAPVEDRVRAYLHSNCSMCHRPGGGGLGSLDLRVSQSLADTEMCAAPDNGNLGLGANARVVRPGDPGASVLFHRMESLDPDVRMPPAGSNEVHNEAVNLVERWINNMTSCP